MTIRSEGAWARRRWVSLAAGVSVACVFVDEGKGGSGPFCLGYAVLLFPA